MSGSFVARWGVDHAGAPLPRGRPGAVSGLEGIFPTMAHAKRTILLIEDEESITTPLAEALERDGFHTELAHTVADGLAKGRAVRPDLVLLDIGLPDGSGLDVCRELRASSSVPIIILSARGEEADRVVGLELGADDYVVKPFSAREVIARIRAVLRRTARRRRRRRRPMRSALRARPGQVQATLNGTPARARAQGVRPARAPDARRRAVVTREQLIDEVWDVNWFGSTKTLDVHISDAAEEARRPGRSPHPYRARRRVPVLRPPRRLA